MVVTVVVVIAKVRSRQKCLDRYLVCSARQPDGWWGGGGWSGAFLVTAWRVLHFGPVIPRSRIGMISQARGPEEWAKTSVYS